MTLHSVRELKSLMEHSNELIRKVVFEKWRYLTFYTFQD